MMFHAMHGLGDGTTSQAPEACIPFTSWSDPFCVIAAISGDYSLSSNRQVDPAITAAQVKGAVPAVPAEAYDTGVPPGGGSDAQTASDTINQISWQSQANANAAAVAAAAAQAAANAPANPPNNPSTPCGQNPNGMLCWLSQNSGAVLMIGVSIAAIGVFMPSKGRK